MSNDNISELETARIQREKAQLQLEREKNLSAGARQILHNFSNISVFCSQAPSMLWLVKGYFALDSINVLFGDPGVGKSTVLIDLACHIATGRPWRGNRVKKGRVIYVAGEGLAGLQKRFFAWLTRNQCSRQLPIDLFRIPVNLTDPGSVAFFIECVRLFTTPDTACVIIDTLNRNFGGGDENSTKDMTLAIASLDAIRLSTGCAVIVAHHSGLMEKGRGRGSSTLKGSADTEYMVETIGNTIQLKNTKAKDFEAPEILAWQRVTQELAWQDEDGDPMTAPLIVESSVININRPQGGNENLIVSLLQKAGGELLKGDARRQFIDSKTDQAAASAKVSFFRAINSLKNKGIVGENGNFYRLANTAVTW
jgi:hypothetical protein